MNALSSFLSSFPPRIRNGLTGIIGYIRTSILILPTLVVTLTAQEDNSNDPYWNQQIGQPGLNSSVRSIAAFDYGNGSALYVGGSFREAGDKQVNHIAKWDGEEWWPLKTGMNGTVLALAVFDDGNGPALYAGGEFTQVDGKPMDHIAKWDGNQWHDVGGGLNGSIEGSAMIVYDDGTGPALYVGGKFTKADHGRVQTLGIAKWDGKNWSSVGEGVQGEETRVETFAIFDDGNGDALFVGGVFEKAGSIVARNIAKWDGKQWSSLGTGLEGGYSGGRSGPRAMATFNDGNGTSLYVGGWFLKAGGKEMHYLAKWDGHRWHPAGDRFSSPVRSLIVFNDGNGDALYAGGYFKEIGGIEVNGVAKWNGENWNPLEKGVSGEYPRVNEMTTWHNDNRRALYVGGMFTSAGGIKADRIAAWVALDPDPQVEIRKTLNLDEAKNRLKMLQDLLTAEGRDERQKEARERGIYEEIRLLHQFISNSENN